MHQISITNPTLAPLAGVEETPLAQRHIAPEIMSRRLIITIIISIVNKNIYQTPRKVFVT